MRTPERWTSRRARLTIFVAVLFASLAGALVPSVSDELVPYNTQSPDSQSRRADRIVESAAGFDPNPGLTVLVQIPDGVDSPQARQRVAEVTRFFHDEYHVARISTVFDAGSEKLVSRDGRSTLVVTNFRLSSDKTKRSVAARALDHFRDTPWAKVGGLDATQVQLDSRSTKDLIRGELLAFPLVFLLSLLFFRSLVSALVPPVLGGLTILFTFLILRGLSEITTISIFALNLVTGLALGLAIDYSLLFIARYREERVSRASTTEAVAATLRTAGRSVVFSALTISGALASLLVFPQSFLFSMGLVGVIVPLLASAVTVVVLPAALQLLGPRINSGAPNWLQRRADRDARPATSGGWYQVSRLVMRRPLTVATLGIVLMIVLSAPALGTRFVMPDERILPRTDSSRLVEESVRADFAGISRAIYAAVQGTPQQAAELAALIEKLPNAQAVPPPRPVAPSTSVITVIPSDHAMASTSKTLVRDIRALDSPVPFAVGGETARFVDQDDALLAHLPYALLIILASVLIFIYLLTGSLILPVKSLVMNILTVGVAFGGLVFVFQGGRFESVLRYEGSGAIDATQPILITALILGLSTDYTVFLLARIREIRSSGVPDREAVALGVERTGRILTAAAFMFCTAVGAFMTADIVLLKQIGLGLVCGVLVDAFVVRALLAPSLMELMGRLNWWAPGPLRRLHRQIGLGEGGHDATSEGGHDATTQQGLVSAPTRSPTRV